MLLVSNENVEFHGDIRGWQLSGLCIHRGSLVVNMADIFKWPVPYKEIVMTAMGADQSRARIFQDWLRTGQWARTSLKVLYFFVRGVPPTNFTTSSTSGARTSKKIYFGFWQWHFEAGMQTTRMD